LGAATYSGLAKIPQRFFFSVTGWLLALLAAGMAGQAAAFLNQAGLLPPLADPLWDSSSLISERHAVGQLLHVLIGYNERPTGMQMLFFGLTLATIIALTIRIDRHSKPKPTHAPLTAALSLAAVGLMGLCFVGSARAAHNVYSPIVEEGEYAIEARGHLNIDSDPEKDRGQQYKVDFEHAPTARWLTEVVAEFEREPGDSLKTTAVEWENIFQLTEQGAHWIDFGVLAAYSRELEQDARDKIEIGALFEKSYGKQVVNFNVLAEHQLGGAEETVVEYAARWRWRRSQLLEPAIEFHGELGEVDHLHSFAEQEHSVGPGLLGKISLRNGAKLKYEAAYLVGISSAAPNTTLRFQVEYEFH
jgi:hypothetical protein